MTSQAYRNSRRIYLSHVYGEPLTTDWANSPPCSRDMTSPMLCYAEHRRAPHLDELDHDAQGF